VNSCWVTVVGSHVFLLSIAIHILHSLGTMTRLAIDTRRRVVILSKNGFTLRDIKACLKEGMHISKTSLCILLKKYRQTGSIVDRHMRVLVVRVGNAVSHREITLAHAYLQLDWRATCEWFVSDMHAPFNLLMVSTVHVHLWVQDGYWEAEVTYTWRSKADRE